MGDHTRGHGFGFGVLGSSAALSQSFEEWEPQGPLQRGVILGGSGDLVSLLSKGPYGAYSGLKGILTGLTKSTAHPSRGYELDLRRREIRQASVVGDLREDSRAEPGPTDFGAEVRLPVWAQIAAHSLSRYTWG